MIHTPILLDVPIPATWLMLKVRSGMEPEIRERLAGMGILGFFPSRNHQHHRNGKTWVMERAEVTGYVFARFTRVPNGDMMRERLRGFFGFITVNETIVTVHPVVIRHLRGLTVQAQELEAAKREMLRLREGDMAMFLSPLLREHMGQVTVKEIGRVIKVLTKEGQEFQTDADKLEKVVDVHGSLR